MSERTDYDNRFGTITRFQQRAERTLKTVEVNVSLVCRLCYCDMSVSVMYEEDQTKCKPSSLL